MFPFDPITELQLVHLRQAEDRRRAEIARWVQDARGTRPPYADRLLSTLGTALVQVGLRLRNDRAESAMVSRPVSATLAARGLARRSTAAALGYPLYVAPRREVRK
jgi:hypothetical protein